MRRVELFRVILAILDPARKLHLIEAVAHSDSSRPAIGLGASLRIVQPAELGASAEIPAFFRYEIDAGGVRETGQRLAVLVALFEVNAGTVGEPSLHARGQVASTDLNAVVRPLVFQRIVQVE